MSDKIYIQKTELKKADAIRINTAEDVPENLRNAIRVQEDGIHMDCTKGAEVAPLGRLIRFEETEKSDNCPNGINSWAISPADEQKRFIEKDGVFYQRPTPTPAAPIEEGVPEWLEGAAVDQKRDGSFEIKTDWGKSSGKPGEAYWVKYGTKEDGTPDANILTKSEKSFDAYSVCTKDGQNLCTLRQFDDTLSAMREQDPNTTFEQAAAQAFRAASGGSEWDRQYGSNVTLTPLKDRSVDSSMMFFSAGNGRGDEFDFSDMPDTVSDFDV